VALVGISITKQCTFRDSIQEFSNIYHYQWAGLNPGQSLADAIIDRLTTVEKVIHTTEVTFLRGALWSAGGTKAENQMISQKSLSGTGSGTAVNFTDRERAWLIYWDAGLDSRNRPVKLRKWFHTCGAFSNVGTVGQTQLENKQAITSGNRTAVEALANDLNPLVVSPGPISLNLVGPTGRATTGNSHCHKYFEHHQLGDMWR
jgi:hypothetical protein